MQEFEPIVFQTPIECTLRLLSAGSKPLAVIKQVCKLTGCTLSEGKKIVDACPTTLLTDGDRQEIAYWQERLEAAGAVVEVLEW